MSLFALLRAIRRGANRLSMTNPNNSQLLVLHRAFKVSEAHDPWRGEIVAQRGREAATKVKYTLPSPTGLSVSHIFCSTPGVNP